MGAYRLVRRIGEGGMGDVYLAERSDGEFEHRFFAGLDVEETDAVVGVSDDVIDVLAEYRTDAQPG